MKQTDIQIFYQLGAALQGIKQLSVGMQNVDVAFKLVKPEEWLKSFLQETHTEDHTIPLQDSRQAAEQLLKMVKRILYPIYKGSRLDSALSSDEFALLQAYLEKFESEFARECKGINVFTVTKKGIYDSRALIETPENKFPQNLRRLLPATMIYDLSQAGKSLAFELPTACAFHICRATETLMLRYCELLMGGPWPYNQRDWGRYIRELRDNGASDQITSRLDEIRKLDRNPYTHPERAATLEDAPFLFEMCTGVIYVMAKEIEKLVSSAS